jgi:hypothetical protein
MNDVTFINLTNPITKEVTAYATIINSDGGFTSMTKERYDTLLSNSSEPVEKPAK